MEQEQLSDVKIYELVLQTKRHEETRRDEINKYHISFFTGIAAAMPLVEKFLDLKKSGIEGFYYMRMSLVTLSVIGLVAATNWIFNLIRINNYLESFDKLLIELEEKSQKQFISYVANYLTKIHSPARVTKQSMSLPGVFILVFLVSLIYNLSYLFPLDVFLDKLQF